VPVFNTSKGSRQQTTVTSTTAVAVFKTTNTSTSSSNTWTFSTGTHDWILVNEGPATICLTNAATSSATSSLGLKVAAGQTLTFTGTVVNFYAANLTASKTATVVVSLATVPYAV
jgi:hypothetical protein